MTLARLGPKGELEVLGEVHLENALTCQFDEEGKLWIMSCEDGGRCEVQVYSISNEGKVRDELLILLYRSVLLIRLRRYRLICLLITSIKC